MVLYVVKSIIIIIHLVYLYRVNNINCPLKQKISYKWFLSSIYKVAKHYLTINQVPIHPFLRNTSNIFKGHSDIKYTYSMIPLNINIYFLNLFDCYNIKMMYTYATIPTDKIVRDICIGYKNIREVISELFKMH